MSPSAIWSFAATTAVGPPRRTDGCRDRRAERGRALRGPVALPPRPRLESGRRELRGGAAIPGDRLQPVGGTGEPGDPPVAEVDQVPHRERRTLHLALRAGAAVQRDDRHPHAGRFERLERAGMRSEHDDPVDPLGEQVAGGGADGCLVRGIRIRGGDPAADRPRGGFEGRDPDRRPVEGGVGGDHPDGARRAGAERPRRVVDAVVEFGHGIEHPPAGLGADVGLVVDDPGHRLRRHAGEARDIAHPYASCRIALAHGTSG